MISFVPFHRMKKWFDFHTKNYTKDIINLLNFNDLNVPRYRLISLKSELFILLGITRKHSYIVSKYFPCEYKSFFELKTFIWKILRTAAYRNFINKAVISPSKVEVSLLESYIPAGGLFEKACKSNGYSNFSNPPFLFDANKNE